MNPYDVVRQFEETIAEYTGAKYAVAVESGTAALFLSIALMKKVWPVSQPIEVPKFTYPSAPMSLIHHGYKVKFTDEDWSKESEYELKPLGIWDSALKVIRPGMYRPGTMTCLSFHHKKYLSIGRGGMILTDIEEAYKWLKRARFDGREEVPMEEIKNLTLGWNMYMTPEQAARGLTIFHTLKDKPTPDLQASLQGYPDLSQFDIFK